jgi:butyrate kinase
MGKRLILAINPGSTTTKFSLFEEDKLVFEKTLTHSSDELGAFRKVTDQLQFRKELIMKALSENGVDFKRITIIVGRGGLLKPIESGIYHVNQKMKDDLMSLRYGAHASNLGALIADDIAASVPGSLAYTVDPVVVDELQDVARISGLPEIERRSIFHALNQKAVSRLYASSVNKRYEDLNLIVAHMGGGISVGAHRRGRVIDVNNALDGDGPFSVERAGGLPSGQFAGLCFSGKYTHAEIKSMLTGKGGIVAHLGTNNFKEVSKMALNDDKARLIKRAVAYQIGKEIGAAAAVMNGRVDAIILTGGLAYDEDHVKNVSCMVSFIAEVVVYPGEDEMKALAFNALLAMDGKLQVKIYS